MRLCVQRLVSVLMMLSLVFLVVTPTWAADPEIDKLLRQSPGKDWITNGGDLNNQRYSTLKQINTANVKQLKGAWMTRLKGSGLVGSTPLRRHRWSKMASCMSLLAMTTCLP